MIQVLFLVLGAAFVIKEAESTGWKLKNASIVLGSTVAGFCLTYILAYFVWSADATTPLAGSLAILPGYLGCLGAAAGNQWRQTGVGKGRRKMPSDKTVI